MRWKISQKDTTLRISAKMINNDKLVHKRNSTENSWYLNGIETEFCELVKKFPKEQLIELGSLTPVDIAKYRLS